MARATQDRQQASKPSNRPVHRIRYGPIQAAIWRNMVDNGNVNRPFYSVTFSRSYRDGQSWKESASFGADDLLLVAKLADEVHTWISHQKTANDHNFG